MFKIILLILNIIFCIEDKSKRIVNLTKERWNHIIERHPDVNNLNLIIQTLENPSIIKYDKFDDMLNYYYKYIKEERIYLLVVVKYIKDKGSIITSFYTKSVK